MASLYEISCKQLGSTISDYITLVSPKSDYIILYNKNQFENELIKPINCIIKHELVLGTYSAQDFKGQRGRHMIEMVLRYGVKDTKLRSQLKRLIYAIIEDDSLLNFFMFVNPPNETGYVRWDCHEMTKVKTLFTSDDETMFTLGFKCRALQMFFSNTQRFYNVFSQQ